MVYWSSERNFKSILYYIIQVYSAIISFQMAKRRRVSSDGLQLFNMAIMEPPKYSKIKKMLSCIFGSEYDDRLDEMVNQCREASIQLYGYTNFKDINTNKLINNSNITRRINE